MIVFFGTYISASAGSKASSETIADGLAARGHTVHLVSRSPWMPVRLMESTWTAARFPMDMAVVTVFSSRVLHLSRAITRILTARRIPYVAALHGGAILERFEIIRPTLEPILRSAAAVTTPSHYLRSGMEARGFSVGRIPNAVNLELFPFRERQAPCGTLRLLWVRAFAEIYRPELAVEVVDHLVRRGIDATLSMVGPDKGLMHPTRERARALGVEDRVSFVGPVPNEELYHYYHSHDFLLNTTRFESFGMAIAEAAATGLPVVSAPVGEVGCAWHDDEDILLVPEDTSAAFAERIAGVCTADPGGHRYRRISVKGWEKVQEYSLPGVLDRWEELAASIRPRPGR